MTSEWRDCERDLRGEPDEAEARPRAGCGCPPGYCEVLRAMRPEVDAP